ncbi:Alpha-1-antichymotrypsin [Dirofilaria immitis]
MRDISIIADRSPKMSVSRIMKSKLSTAISSTSKDINLDDTQMSPAPLTTSYVIKSQRQKPKQAVAIYFAPMKQRPDIALTEMQLCNNADVPLLFKLRSDTISRIMASPAGSGCIPPRAEQRCFLTWRLQMHQQEQQNMKAPKLILITNFVEQEIDDNQTVETKLIEGKRSEEQIPLMKFTFEKKQIISPSETFSAYKESTAAQSMKMDYAREKTLIELNHLIQWFQRHPLETMMILLFFIALFIATFN